MADFKLYIGNKCFSSWSLRPWVAMKHLEIPFEEEFVRLRTPETAANLAKISPTGQVPVLNHNGRIVWETLAILEYLADLFPEKKLWPRGDRRAGAGAVGRHRDAFRFSRGPLRLADEFPAPQKAQAARRRRRFAEAADRGHLARVSNKIRRGRPVSLRPFHSSRCDVRAGSDTLRHVWWRSFA